MKNNSKINLFKNDQFTKTKTELLKEIQEAPLKKIDIEFMMDVINGASYKDLQSKYNLSQNGVYAKKTRCINKYYRFLFYQGKN